MLKRINQILNIIIGSSFGFFIGNGIYTFWYYKTHPDFYEIQSAPWYTDTLIYGIFMLIVWAICFILKIMIRKKMKV